MTHHVNPPRSDYACAADCLKDCKSTLEPIVYSVLMSAVKAGWEKEVAAYGVMKVVSGYLCNYDLVDEWNTSI